MLAPAIMPVAAGKNTANKEKNDSSPHDGCWLACQVAYATRTKWLVTARSTAKPNDTNDVRGTYLLVPRESNVVVRGLEGAHHVG